MMNSIGLQIQGKNSRPLPSPVSPHCGAVLKWPPLSGLVEEGELRLVKVTERKLRYLSEAKYLSIFSGPVSQNEFALCSLGRSGSMVLGTSWTDAPTCPARTPKKLLFAHNAAS